MTILESHFTHHIFIYTVLICLNPFSVVVAVAMEAEAMPFVKYLNLKEDKSFYSAKNPFEAFTGDYNGCQVTVVTNGKDSVHGKKAF